MLAWLDERLFEQEVAEVDAFNLREEGLSRDELRLARLDDALWAARAGEAEPLRKLHPHLAPFLYPPKLGRGQKYPKTRRVQEAVGDVPRIRQLWRDNYPQWKSAEARPRRRSSRLGGGASARTTSGEG
jgi:hypothetical protein